MENNQPLAHSARPKQGIPPQTYLEHVSNVCKDAICNACNAAAYYSGDRDTFINGIEAAALYHDLGKLDEANQTVLQEKSRERLPIAHEDAGVAELDKLGRQEAVVLACGHHAGLFSLKLDVLGTQGRPFRNLGRIPQNDEKVADHVDHYLREYENAHAAAGCSTFSKTEPSGLHRCGFTRRLALSCLVDADHGDTARHYGNELKNDCIEPRWKDRLEALKRYVDGLPDGKSERERNRNLLRKKMFETCLNAPLDPSIRTCDAPVGSGKTTAVMAHLLRVAAERKPQLRHIIVILPYTNIITQSVEIYRKALVLEGERPEDIVAEHHHRADFEDVELRQLATLWRAPIIVTTAVQFFETLGSSYPSRLRKLHELPGSAVFVDEMHAAIPSHLWPQMWMWLESFTQNWGGHIVLASGSLAQFWKVDEYVEVIRNGTIKDLPDVPDLVANEILREQFKKTEERRIRFQRRPEKAEALDCKSLIDFVIEKAGPRILIVNTVQTAAVIADSMRKAGHSVLHLSTALAPAHRDSMVERVKLRLRDKIENWTLVATSCVEAGMNFSFRTGFRERASTASLIQIGGRVSRGDEFLDAEVWDILLRDELFCDNPTITISKHALDGFTPDELNNLHPATLATFAMKREWSAGAKRRAEELIENEKQMEYQDVSKQCRVIESDTRTVVIDKGLAQDIRNGEKVPKGELLKYSVQMWYSKIANLKLDPLNQYSCSDESNLYAWNYNYDPNFLGYMDAIIPRLEMDKKGFEIV